MTEGAGRRRALERRTHPPEIGEALRSDQRFDLAERQSGVDAAAVGERLLGVLSLAQRLDTSLTPQLQSELPEPGTLALFGLGLAGLGWAARRRRG